MRPSVLGLMAVIPAVALGLVAIRGASPAAHWSVAVAVGLLGLSALLAASARHRWRFALAAFASIGSLYLALCFGPGLVPAEVEYLPTTAALDRLFPAFFPESYIRDQAARREYCSCSQCVAGVREGLRSGYFQAGHVVSGLLVAALSGLAVWCIPAYPARWHGRRAGSAA